MKPFLKENGHMRLHNQMLIAVIMSDWEYGCFFFASWCFLVFFQFFFFFDEYRLLLESEKKKKKSFQKFCVAFLSSIKAVEFWGWGNWPSVVTLKVISCVAGGKSHPVEQSMA